MNIKKIINIRNKQSIPLTMKIFYNLSDQDQDYVKKRFKYKELLFDIVWIENTRRARKLIRKFK